ncbi:CoA-binding protein [Deminuibacter soli]|uniref:CoA-binding protein n=1 Tax=Deminuibacter soli TaxID=2291815 RepID=A0A3E1NFX8_9BACT|nr:CoA-binding protein [Deminuibacter soli]RFM26721.1 CoA-binding protein [Deminuibacter soli]
MNSAKNTVVLGASPNPQRYSYLAVSRLKALGYPVTAIGKKEGQIGDVSVITDHPALTGTDTVTMYLGPANQRAYYEYILSLHPKRIIFNPGAENEELAKLAEENGIEAMYACTLVLLGTGQY